MFLTGVLQAVVVLIQSVFFNIFIRIANLHSDLNGILFACICGIAASFILLLYAGPGKLGISSMKNWATWVYGFCGLSQFALDIYLAQYVSATELSLFSRLAIPISIIMAFIFLKRTPAKQDIVAVLSIILGSLILFYVQDSSNLQTVIIFVAMIAIFRAGEFMSTEVHSQSASANKIGNMKDRARVVGFASFSSSILFLLTCFALSFIKEFYHINNNFINAFPSVTDYLDSYTIILGVLYGLFITAFARFCIWSATYKIKTENVLAILVFIPILTYLSEISISALFNIQINSNMFSGERGNLVLLALVFMTLGSAISIIPKVLKNVNKQKGQTWVSAFKDSIKQQGNNYEIQHDSIDRSDYDVLQHTLAYYDGNYEDVASIYGISTDAVKVVLISKGNSGFIDDVSNKIHKIYQNEIVVKDKLTKAKNRLALSMDINNLISENNRFSIILLDLNDFKPVNDTFGHDAGDAALKETALRLEQLFSNRVYRLGGDEFVLIYNDVVSEELKNKIKEIISKEISYNNKTFNIGTSIGVAEFSENGLTQQSLLDYADKNLYKDKETKKNTR